LLFCLMIRPPVKDWLLFCLMIRPRVKDWLLFCHMIRPPVKDCASRLHCEPAAPGPRFAPEPLVRLLLPVDAFFAWPRVVETCMNTLSLEVPGVRCPAPRRKCSLTAVTHFVQALRGQPCSRTLLQGNCAAQLPRQPAPLGPPFAPRPLVRLFCSVRCQKKPAQKFIL
jgi:hypothetical protein